MVSRDLLIFLTVTLLTVIVLMATNLYLRAISRLKSSRREHVMSPAEIRRRIEEGNKHFKEAWDLLEKIVLEDN